MRTTPQSPERDEDETVNGSYDGIVAAQSHLGGMSAGGVSRETAVDVTATRGTTGGGVAVSHGFGFGVAAPALPGATVTGEGPTARSDSGSHPVYEPTSAMPVYEAAGGPNTIV